MSKMRKEIPKDQTKNEDSVPSPGAHLLEQHRQLLIKTKQALCEGRMGNPIAKEDAEVYLEASILYARGLPDYFEDESPARVQALFHGVLFFPESVHFTEIYFKELFDVYLDKDCKKGKNYFTQLTDLSCLFRPESLAGKAVAKRIKNTDDWANFIPDRETRESVVDFCINRVDAFKKGPYSENAKRTLEGVKKKLSKRPFIEASGKIDEETIAPPDIRSEQKSKENGCVGTCGLGK